MTAEPSIHPFPGLRPFEANEEHLFFGREGQSEEILRRLREHRFLAVVGSSGSGKSSLIRAGLLPYLYGGFLADSGSHWRIAIFRPGGDPLGNLAAALNDPAVLGQASAGKDAAAQDAMLLEVSLRRSGLGLIDAVKLARLPDRDQVLVVVDQFEELFRFANAAGKPRQEDDAAAFVKLLLEASAQRDLPIYVVLTMRSDFIGDCARYRDLPEAVTSGLYLIPRMTREQHRAAIVEPVRVGGGAISPRLVVRLLNSVGDDPDQLPILQHAMMRCWDYWMAHDGEARPIDIDDYVAIGGMAEALSLHVDEAYDGLPDDRFRAIARRVFQALTEKGSDNREARRPTTVATLAEVTNAPVGDIIRIVDEFRQPGRSFLMPPTSVALEPGSLIDISHESLIRGWQRLRQWVEEEAESAKIYRRLAETAALHQLGTAGLLHDPDLTHALEWRETEHPNATWADRYYPGFAQAMEFLEKSRIARDTEQHQTESKRRRVLAASLAAAVLLGIFGIGAGLEWYSARQALKTAATERDRAQQGLTAATQLASTLVFDIGQDPRLHNLPPEMLSAMFDRAIEGYDQVIKINPTAEEFNGRGNAYRDKGDLDRAIADFDQAIKLDPKAAYVFNNRGLAYSDKNDLDHAIADYSEAIVLNPKYAHAYYGRGRAYRQKGKLDEAIADLSQAINFDAKYVFAFNERGLAYYDKSDYDHAIVDLTQAITIDPQYAFAYNNRGLAYTRKGDIDHAIADYDRAIRADPKYVHAYDNRGDAYVAKNDLDHALADYSQAITLDPKYTIAYNDRGLVYFDKGDFDHAIADFSQAITLDPKFAIAYNNRGLAEYKKDNIDLAIADYDRAITLDPKYSHAYDNRGDAYRARSDFDHAIADYSQAIALDPKYGLAYRSRGNAYRAKGDLDHAIADLSQAILLAPRNAFAYNDRGLAYNEKDDYDDAIADYSQAITLEPKYALIYANRGETYRAKGDFDQAIADLSQAIALDAKYTYAYYVRGRAYAGKGDFDHAIADFSQAITIDPKYSAAYYGRGNAYAQKSDFDHAIPDYNQAIILFPRYAAAYNGRCWARVVGGHQLQQALSDCNESLRLRPNDADTLDSRGFAYLRLGQFDNAIADFTAAFAVNPKLASSLYGRGLAKLKKGDRAGADADMAAAKAIQTDVAELLAGFGIK